jgi:hypothetical protein
MQFMESFDLLRTCIGTMNHLKVGTSGPVVAELGRAGRASLPVMVHGKQQDAVLTFIIVVHLRLSAVSGGDGFADRAWAD